MKTFFLVSPSGRKFNVIGDSIYHAVQKLVDFENWQYSNIDYLKLNKHD